MKRIGTALVAGALLLAGCGGDGEQEGAAAQPQRQTVTVLAAASLTDVFQELEPAFERANPGADLRFNFAASSDLASQIVAGAPADVFASANEKQMQKVAGAGLLDGRAQLFATNTLTIAVPPGNPKGIEGFADLARPDVNEVVCAPQVPCGAATGEIEQATGVALSPASEEPDVRSVLSKVASADADAGLVYVTDVATTSDVESVAFPEAGSAVNEYPIAVIAGAPAGTLGRAFVDFVRGDRGRQALQDAGFGPP
ncbi:MAG: molybdate ABC transporter substrate-binding protein [Pseudonocardiaceae bacterium]